jgi:hypothetical protein
MNLDGRHLGGGGEGLLRGQKFEGVDEKQEEEQEEQEQEEEEEEEE